MKFILGKKLNMTQIWKGEEVIAITRVQAGPCAVVQVKINEKDGYDALQIGFGERKEKNIKKPQIGHLNKSIAKKSDKKVNIKFLREFRDNNENVKAGDMIDVSTFEPGDIVQVAGVSKGKGFQGVVKRHGFHGHNITHGTKDQVRMPGSIGATGPSHVFKGMRMPGRMGGENVTVKNLEIVEVDLENNILLIKGAVPGVKNGLVLISGEGELKVKSEPSSRAQAEGNLEEKKLENEDDKTEEVKSEKEEETQTDKNTEDTENTESSSVEKVEKNNGEDADKIEIKEEEKNN